MPANSFFGGRVKKWNEIHDQWIDGLWIILLLVAAVLLFTIDLGTLPLRDWDEGTVAQVAREIWRAPIDSMTWLYPTLGGEPYLNKPPLMHWLIATAYALGGVSEWTARLPGALLSAISVPLLYLIARELFYQRICAIYSALVYLTMLPVVRHGRLAMLDGGAVFFFLMMILWLLRSRRNLVYCLGVGISLGLICLTKGMLGLLLAAIALIFLLWDTPRLLTSFYLWVAIFLGMIPVALWYGAQWWHYGHLFSNIGVMNQSLSRIWQPVEGHAHPPWFYILEILKYTWPWLLFFPQALRLCWNNRNLSWAKLLLVWMGGYLLTISIMGTKLPWYVFPIYPSIALVIGVLFGEIQGLPLLSSYPRYWVPGLILLAIASCGINIYYSWNNSNQPELQLILVAVAITMGLAAVLATKGDKQFLQILVWGSYLSLLLLMQSQHWVWELGERYPVKPVAEIVKQGTPPGTKIYTSNPEHRPSLNFYSDRSIIPWQSIQLQDYWQHNQQPYLLLTQDALEQIQLDALEPIDQSQGWILVTKESKGSDI
ncbi:MAG: glycosyltransferase family 39 protein [Calothrix sp. MO_167.B42]|nr:glycosyltransferase family 39 protein [Calothrix sp. MO_167.B42]